MTHTTVCEHLRAGRATAISQLAKWHPPISPPFINAVRISSRQRAAMNSSNATNRGFGKKRAWVRAQACAWLTRPEQRLAALGQQRHVKPALLR
eukprot:3188728-Pleurochrysis_carterae.AAC.1